MSSPDIKAEYVLYLNGIKLNLVSLTHTYLWKKPTMCLFQKKNLLAISVPLAFVSFSAVSYSTFLPPYAWSPTDNQLLYWSHFSCSDVGLIYLIDSFSRLEKCFPRILHQGHNPLLMIQHKKLIWSENKMFAKMFSLIYSILITRLMWAWFLF